MTFLNIVGTSEPFINISTNTYLCELDMLLYTLIVALLFFASYKRRQEKKGLAI